MKTTTNLRGVPLWALLAAAASGCAVGEEASEANDQPESAGVAPSTLAAPSTPAGRLVARSSAFHDPDGVWGTRPITMSWVGTNSEGAERVAVDLSFGADESEFALSGRYAGSTIEYETSDEGWSVTVDGETELSDETVERMRLGREDGMFWRSYYGFLAGLPMKITDPGAHLEPEIIETSFEGRAVQAVKVTYDPDVGADTWYFYFDPDTAELVGCRFYHDESANDGEYITFEGLSEGGGLRLPKNRSWYMNADDRHLGSDEVGSIEVSF